MRNNLIWFRNDLRTLDNVVLNKATEGDFVLGVYFFDPRHYETGPFGFKKTERFRAQFLLETVSELRQSLDELNITLLVHYGKPEDIIPKLIAQHKITSIFSQKEWTSEEVNVSNKVKSLIPEETSWIECFDQFLFHPEDIPFTSYQSIPDVFTNFRKACEKSTQVRGPLPKPAVRPKENKVENITQLPDLSTLGLEAFKDEPRSAFPFRGGEHEALKRLNHYFWKSKKLAYYKKTRNGLIGPDYSSKFSPWLANGSISARTIFSEVKCFELEVTKNQDTYWLIFELIWRDYFKYVSLKHNNHIFKLGGILQKDYEWEMDPILLEKWIHGETSEPFVNANMRELQQTGWMSNRGRQNVASYWAKELQQDWRVGASYFEAMLVDYDVHSNWGNWMYNSGVGNDPRNRKFNISRQAQMYDSKGKYQRLWLQQTLF